MQSASDGLFWRDSGVFGVPKKGPGLLTLLTSGC
jgi:hypothetical protein